MPISVLQQAIIDNDAAKLTTLLDSTINAKDEIIKDKLFYQALYRNCSTVILDKLWDKAGTEIQQSASFKNKPPCIYYLGNKQYISYNESIDDMKPTLDWIFQKIYGSDR
jgi:hypothetical protein